MKRNELRPVNLPESNPEAGIYFVPSYKIEGVEKKLKSLVRRGTKLGCNPVAYQIGETATFVTAHDRELRYDSFNLADDKWYEVIREFTKITVSGEAPKYDGWRLVARLLHSTQTGIDNATTIVNAVPGETVPVKFRSSGCVCDHCQGRKIRKDTFVVAKGDEFKQVGTSCLRDFLGHNSPENIVAQASYYSDGVAGCFGGDDDREETPEGLWVRGALLTGVGRMMAVVAAHHRVFGWTSKKQAMENPDQKGASISTVISVLFYPPKSDNERALYKKLEPTEADEASATKAIEWAKGLAGTSDFEHNMKAIAAAGTVSSRTIGIAAAIYGCWRKATEVAATKAAAPATAYVGSVGERITLEGVKVLSARCVGEGAYGPSWLIKMEDVNGNPLTWFTNNEKFQAGETVSIKATVKKHDEFRGTKQTVLTRVTDITPVDVAIALS